MIGLRLIDRLEVRLILLMVEHHYIQDQADLDDQAEADRQARGKVNTSDGRTSLYTGPG